MRDIPACSPMALLSTGFSHSLHLTTPTSALSGLAPNIFMSRAESHDVGGEGRTLGSAGGEGDLGRFDQENGSGEGSVLGLSLNVIVGEDND